MKKLIIIPTYNEKSNIKSLIEQINDLNINNLDILIVDDNSPDKTADLVKEMQNDLTNLFIIERPKKLGLGTAYITGFKWAIDEGYDVVMEMDADFSHAPKYLPEIFKQSQEYDFVIASRYVKNGGVKNWSLIRQLISKMGSLYARIILGVKIYDFTGGFNAWNIKVLKKLNLDQIKSNGYSFQIEMKFQAATQGFKFIETPIIFYERRAGQSKMSQKIVIEAMWRVIIFRLNFFKKELKKVLNSEHKIKDLFNSRLIGCIYILILVLVSLFMLFYGLGHRSLQNWDEAIYALMSQDLVQNPSLTLKLNNTLWFEKPPLGFWLESLAIAVLGFSEFAIRLFSSIYIFITIILVYFLGKELFNKHIGFLGAFITIISPSLIHDHMARSGDLDSGLLLFTVLAYYLLIKALKNPKFLAWSGVAAGLAIMIRGSSGVFIIITCVLYLLLSGYFKKFKLKDYLYYLLGLLIIVLPWHVQQLIVHGKDFWDIYVMEHFLSRIVTPIQSHAGKWDYYFMYLRWKNGLVHYLVWLSFFYSLWQVFFYKNKKILLPILWLVITLIPLMMMQTKLWWYVIALIPAMMILVSFSLYDIVKKRSWILILGVNMFLTVVWLVDDKINNYQYSFKNLVLFLVIVLLVSILILFFLKISNKKKFLVTFLSIYLTLFFIGLNLMHLRNDYELVTKQQPEPIEILATTLKGEDSVNNLIVYNTQTWYKGWILPQADYYFDRQNNIKTILIGPDNLEYYIDNDEYWYFLTTQNQIGDIIKIANNNFDFIKFKEAGELIVLKKIRLNFNN